MDYSIDLGAAVDLSYTPWFRTLFQKTVLSRGWRGRVLSEWKVTTLPKPDNPLWFHEEPDYHFGCYEMGGGLVALTAQGHNKMLRVEIATDSPVDAPKVLAEVRKMFPEAPPPPDNEVEVNFWMMANMGPRRVDREIDVPSWAEIEDNYAAETKRGIEPLFGDFRPASGGRLMLWHGEPGTGKTFAIRALARDWKPWCGVDYVTDPEQFFGSASYMTDVLLGNDALDSEGTKWRLVVLEDAGELMSADARLRTGQGLSRLLNVTDGLIGQGLRVLVLITTNEDIGSLHEAVSRPGRCLSSVNFAALNNAEARKWLAAHNYDGDTSGGTLAELYARMDEDRLLAPAIKQKVGFAA